MTPCARCRRSPAAPGYTRCPACRLRDRTENRARYVKRGGWGGLRVAGDRIAVTIEGNVARVQCRCGARIAGTFDPAEVVAQHASVCPLARRRDAVLPAMRQASLL